MAVGGVAAAAGFGDMDAPTISTTATATISERTALNALSFLSACRDGAIALQHPADSRDIWDSSRSPLFRFAATALDGDIAGHSAVPEDRGSSAFERPWRALTKLNVREQSEVRRQTCDQ